MYAALRSNQQPAYVQVRPTRPPRCSAALDESAASEGDGTSSEGAGLLWRSPFSPYAGCVGGIPARGLAGRAAAACPARPYYPAAAEVGACTTVRAGGGGGAPGGAVRPWQAMSLLKLTSAVGVEDAEASEDMAKRRAEVCAAPRPLGSARPCP